MRQFDAFLNPSERRRDVAPYFVVLSSHHLQSIDEAVVAPLIRDWSKSLNGVDVVLDWRGEILLLAMTELFSMPSAQLRSRAGDLLDKEDVIRRALERLFSGF